MYYSLPGGLHEVGESLADTVKREFKEETGIAVELGGVALVREFIIEGPEIAVWPEGIHQVEVIYHCKRIGERQAAKTVIPDIGMTGLRWIAQEEFDGLTIYPTKDLHRILNGQEISYLFSRE